ncbi:MAG: LamG-like jellyroll fold domain-containing protein [Bacteroidota bacterium]
MKKTTTFLILLLFGTKTFAQIPTDNLLCHMKFGNNLNEEVNASTATIIGELNSVSFAEDRFGNDESALSLSNTPHGYVSLGDLNLVDPDYTISLWMKFSDFSSNQRKVISKRAGCSGGSLFDVTMYASPNTLVLESYAQGSAVANINDNTELNSATWMHVVFVVDQANLETKYYIDGALIATTNWGTGLVDGTMDNSADITLGYSPCVNGTTIEGYNGLLDDLRIYTRALNATEVSALYAEANPATSIVEENEMNKLLVFPNPANDILNMQLPTDAEVTVLNISGAELMKTRVQQNHQVDISSLSKGVYFVRTAEGQTVKFIKE